MVGWWGLTDSPQALLSTPQALVLFSQEPGVKVWPLPVSAQPASQGEEPTSLSATEQARQAQSSKLAPAYHTLNG